MDREIAPKPQKPRVQWDPKSRIWLAPRHDHARIEVPGARAAIFTFVTRVNALNGRYDHA